MAVKRIRGFRFRLRLVRTIRWARQTHSRYGKLKHANRMDNALTRICKFGRILKRSLKEICLFKSGSNYARIVHENSDGKQPVPRGHLAVYFGERVDDAHRVLVPVIYFNHPYFGDLLRESEKLYGFDHHGGIHVPCRISEFENVQTRICAAGRRNGYGRSWRSWW